MDSGFFGIWSRGDGRWTELLRYHVERCETARWSGAGKAGLTAVGKGFGAMGKAGKGLASKTKQALKGERDFHIKDVDWKDTNVANIGSDEDKAARKAAAHTEPAWSGAGAKPGLQVWRPWSSPFLSPA